MPFGVANGPGTTASLAGEVALPGPRPAQGMALTPSSSDRRSARAAMRSKARSRSGATCTSCVKTSDE